MPRANSTDRSGLYGFVLLIASVTFACTGCQYDVAGQTLPSPYYIYDDVQYFPSGPKFKLTNEAESMESYSEDEGSVEK